MKNKIQCAHIFTHGEFADDGRHGRECGWSARDRRRNGDWRGHPTHIRRAARIREIIQT